MKQIYLLLALSLLFASCKNKSGQISQNLCKNCDYTVRVTGIADGDTFRGLIIGNKENNEIRFRLYGIDAPEKSQAFGNKSKQYLSDLIFQQTVKIKIQTESDSYGRPIVWVYTSEGQDVGAEMLKAGMAWHFKRYDSSTEYANLEIQARQQKLGLWKDDNPIAPWSYRKTPMISNN